MKYCHLCVQICALVVDISLLWTEFSMSCTRWDVMKPVIYIIMWLCISIWMERHILLFSIGMGLMPVPSPSFYDCIWISYSHIIISDQTLCPNMFMIAVTYNVMYNHVGDADIVAIHCHCFMCMPESSTMPCVHKVCQYVTIHYCPQFPTAW